MADEQSKKRGLQDDMAVAIQNKRAALTATSNPLASSPSEQDLYIKLICPASIAGLIIGKSGTTIGNLNRTTGAKIQVSQNQDVYPGTTDKVIVVNGNRECIGVALKELVTLIGEAPSRRGPGGKPLMDANGNPMTPPNKTAEGDFVISVLIPKMASGILIGKQGIVVKEMSANSNCKMQLGDNKDLYMTGERAFIVSSPTVPSLVLGVHAVMMQLMSDQRVRIYANKTVVYANTGGPMGGGGSGGGMTAPLPPPPQQRQGYPHHHQQQGAYPQLNVPTAGGPPMRNQIPQQQQPQAPVTMGYNELGQLVPNPPQVVMGAPQQQQQQYPPNAGMAGMPPQMGVPVQQMQPQYPPQNVLQQQQYPPQKGASQQKQKQKQPPAQRGVPPQQQAPYMDTVSSPGMAPVNAVMGGMPPPHQGAMQQQIPQQQIPQQQMPQQQMPQQQLYPPQNAIQQQQQYPPQNTMQQQQYPPQNSLQQQQYPPQKGATLQQQQQYHEQKTVHQQKGKQHQSQSIQKGPPQQHQQQQYPPQQQYQQQQQHQPGMMQQQYQQHQQQQPGMMQQQYPQQPGAMQQALPAQQQQQQQQQYPQQAMQGMAQPQMQIPVQVPPAIGMNGGTGGGYMMPNVPGPQQQMYVQNLPQTQQQPLQQQQQYGRGAPRGGAR